MIDACRRQTLLPGSVRFEPLTLAGRSFPNACKVSFRGATTGQLSVAWRAKGFGWIRIEEQTAQGALVPGSRVEIAKIISAP